MLARVYAGLGALLCAGAVACTEAATASEPVPFDTGGYPSFAATWSVATHNTYWVDRGTSGDAFASGTSERLLDQLCADHARGVEIDIHRAPGAPGRWLVYHTVPGNGLCRDLGECLGVLRAFHATLPDHELVTVVIELKELFAPNFDPSHSIADLDALFESELGPLLFRPADVMRRCDGHLGEESLGACVARVGWPGIAALRGRFALAILGNWDSFSQGTVDWARYAIAGDIRERAAFPMASAWKLDHAALPPPLPDLLSADELARAADASVFLQVEALEDAVAPAFLARGAVVRMDATSLALEEGAVAARMQLLQSDTPEVQFDDRGPDEPLRAFDASAFPPERLREPGVRFGLAAGPPDARVFAYRDEASAPSARWEATLSFGADATQSGCVRAASALGGNDTSAMVCGRKLSGRLPAALGGAQGSADAERFFARFIACTDGLCTTEELGSNDGGGVGGVGELVALVVEPGPNGATCARAESARTADRALVPSWTPVGSAHCFAVPLPYRGIARPAAANASALPMWFFGVRAARDGATPEALAAADFGGVATEPSAPGSPTGDDPSLLVDRSYAAP